MLSLLPLLLVGCDELDALLGGVTDPEVADGLVVGVRALDGVDLTGTRYAAGGRAAAYLTRLGDDTPVSATLTLGTPEEGEVALVDEGEGVWATPEERGLAYPAGEPFVLYRDGAEILRAEAAPAAVVSLPTTHAPGEPLAVDASGQDYDALLAVVLDLDAREERWTNTPTDADAVQAMLLDEARLAFEIPGDAFPGEGRYAVGLAGLRANSALDVTDVNTLTSVMATGLVEFHALTLEE